MGSALIEMDGSPFKVAWEYVLAGQLNGQGAFAPWYVRGLSRESASISCWWSTSRLNFSQNPHLRAL